MVAGLCCCHGNIIVSVSLHEIIAYSIHPSTLLVKHTQSLVYFIVKQ